MPELRRFAPNVPIVLVGTKLGRQQLHNRYSDCAYCCAIKVVDNRYRYVVDNIKLIIFIYLSDIREDSRYFAEHMGSNVITSAQVSIVYFLQ
jgi:hypothetical protein